MANRVQLIFQHPSGYGWSEDYWSNRSTSDLFGGQLQVLRDARLALLATDCTLLRARVSSGTYRNPDTFIFASPQNPNGAGPDTAAADFVRILVSTQANAGYGRIYLGGVPSVWVKGDALQFGDAALQKAFAQFRLILTGAPGLWGLMSTNTGAAKQFYQMTNAIPADPRGFLFESPDLPITAFPQQIYVKGSTIPGYNGIKTVLAQNSVIPSIRYYAGGARPPAPTVNTDLVVFSLQDPVFSQFISASAVGITERRSGRPFGQRRGRARNRIPLRQ